MKKKLFIVMFMVITLLMAGSFMFGDSGEDYKVIKKGIKGKGGKAQYLKITVFNKAKKKNTVKLKFPLALIEMFADCTKDSININSKCDFDLKKILKVLKKNGPMTLVEVEEDDELIKIWFEQ